MNFDKKSLYNVDKQYSRRLSPKTPKSPQALQGALLKYSLLINDELISKLKEAT